MRGVLIVDAGAPAAFSAALASGASALLLHLGAAEEGPARQAARAQARALLGAATRCPGGPALFVQIASAGSAAVEADLDALTDDLPTGVFLEACEGRADVQRLSVKLAAREALAGVPEGATRIVALAAQTPAGVFALGGYAGASPRLAALALDTTPLPGGPQAGALARALLLLGAAAAGVPALESAPRRGEAGIDAACAAARRDGFAGMLTRRPEEIGPIEAIFRAS